MSDPELDPDPDPLARGTDPGIRIWIWNRTKMSRIPNTAQNISNVYANRSLLAKSAKFGALNQRYVDRDSFMNLFAEHFKITRTC
jgi:hypothetical protein